MLEAGAFFAGYTVVRLVGSGPMGEVYLAQHPRLPRQDALKIFTASSSTDPDFRERFNREADAAATLVHPNIVRVHDRGEFDGQLWIAADYVDGTDAGQLMRAQYPHGMPVNEVSAIVTATSEALDFAHRRGVWHRDVKPTNILLPKPVDGVRRVLLTDFGIPRQPGGGYGGPDQSGLAATAFQLLTGAQPQSPVAKLSDRRPELAHLDQVFARALSGNPTDLFDSCADFATAFCQQIGMPPSPQRPRRPKHLRVAAGSVVAIALLVVGVAIGYMANQPKNKASSTPAAGMRPPNAFGHPPVDSSLLPADGTPGPTRPTKQTSYCQEVAVLPDTNFRVRPAYMDMLNLPAAWQFGRGRGIKVALIDTGVSPHTRLPRLVGGGDYVLAGGDGLSDCDAHGTIVASMIAAAPSSSDAYSGVAPDTDLISIRQFSLEFHPVDTGAGSRPTDLALDSIHTLARAIVHAANLGAAVINISEPVCMNAHAILDQGDLGAAVRYAAVDKNVVIVAGAGDTTARDCTPNPIGGPLKADAPRDWGHVATVATPDWFDEYVLTVGATDSTGEPMSWPSLAGPWVSVAAPASDLVGLSPDDDNLINAIRGPANALLVPAGSGFSAAIVSGVAALVRAKYPKLSSRQIVNRLVRTARPPSGRTNDQIGYGVVDPVASLTRDVPEGPR
jgi:type VII secretion-associated serine protease mycosin